jgi:alkylation response protein AidB-like acyl-CoA dehydrogenase
MRESVMAAPDARYNVESLRERAARLIPTLRERAVATSKERRVSDQTIRDLWDADLFSLLKPKKFGGPALRPDHALQVANELARGDGSVAWVWAVVTIHDLFVALFPLEFQQEYWAKEDTLSASSFPPMGKPTPASGGVRISGKWSFCSGVDNADWLFLGVLYAPPSAVPPRGDVRYMMVPKGECHIVDDWDVLGLRGTGSKSVVLDDVFVPDHRILALAAMQQGTTPGGAVHEDPLYRTPLWSFIPFTISAPANGIARGALESFIDEMKLREGSLDHSPLAQKPGTQLRIAEASAMIDAGDLLYRRSFRETIDKLLAGETLSVEHRARSRRDQTYSILLAKEAAGKLFAATGGRGLHEASHVQRAFRDLQAVSSHIAGGWDLAAYSYGRVMLGGPPDDMFM